MYIENINSYVYIEQVRYNLNTISEDLQKVVKEYGGIKIKDSELWFNITGFIVFENKLVVILPKGYILKNDIDIIVEDIKLLFDVMMKYQKESSLKPEEMLITGGGFENDNSSLFAAYNLINDFNKDGFLKRNIGIVTNQPTGRLNWVETLNKKNPVFSDGYPIYYDALYNKNVGDQNNLIIKLQKYAIWKSVLKYGWLMEIDQDRFINFSGELFIEMEDAVKVLQKELRKTYIQRDINVLNWIINIISEVDSTESTSDIQVLLTKSYYYVWEAICSKIFDNQYSRLKILLPQPVWSIKRSSKNKLISHRPDILVIKDDKFLIIDAKYYDVDIDLPGWKDVVKQFFYGLSIKKNIENNFDLIKDNKLKNKIEGITDFHNIFILPTFKEEGISYLGHVKVTAILEYGKIDSYVINSRLAMQCYVGEKKYNFIDFLFSNIMEK